jgi:hypothetical protein
MSGTPSNGTRAGLVISTVNQSSRDAAQCSTTRGDFLVSSDKPDRGHGHTCKITHYGASEVLRSSIAGVSTMLNTFVGNGAVVRAGLLQHMVRLLPTADGPEVSRLQRRHKEGRRG